MGKKTEEEIGSPSGSGSLPTLMELSQDTKIRREPLCTPASRIALGIALNEELRTWMMGKTRKNDPTKVMLGVSSAQDRARDAPHIVNAEPPPLLTIVDINLDLTEHGETSLYDWGENAHRHLPPEEAKVARDVEFDMALHVCGDGVTRVPEMIKALKAECESVHDFVRQARATIWAATSQASYISNVGPTISAGYANTAISSSKKISVADNHRLPLLTAFDVYASGITNVEPSHVGTPYAGTYGCPIDHGISPPGLYAHNYRSDKRQHGTPALEHPFPSPSQWLHICTDQRTDNGLVGQLGVLVKVLGLPLREQVGP